jgi:hypothetical protein
MLAFIGLSGLLAGWLSRYSFNVSALLMLLPPPEKKGLERACAAFLIKDSAVVLILIVKLPCKYNCSYKNNMRGIRIISSPHYSFSEDL